mmetsp:Transcript_45640/g.108667  ORF Transcript_45640/g.108667 Transcript_45640/m.108667 type:complete len:221 (-) Transcript_45640:581-1243(-)
MKSTKHLEKGEKSQLLNEQKVLTNTIKNNVDAHDLAKRLFLNKGYCMMNPQGILMENNEDQPAAKAPSKKFMARTSSKPALADASPEDDDNETPCDSSAAGKVSPESVEKVPAAKSRRRKPNDVNAEIHRNHVQWDKVPPVHIRVLLDETEPVSCASGVIFDSLVGNQRELPRDTGMKVFEFMFGINPSNDVGDVRVLKDLLLYPDCRPRTSAATDQHRT